MKRTLVAFFSAQGNTKRLANTVALAVKGDLFEIKPEKPYTRAELNWMDDASRTSIEMKDKGCRPDMISLPENMEEYDRICLGFPIWWYTAPRIINTFLESIDTVGKTVIPFATSGSSSFGDTESDLRVSAPNAVFKPGRVLKSSATTQTVKDWLENLD